MKHGSRTQIIEFALKIVWNEFKQMTLKGNLRVNTNEKDLKNGFWISEMEYVRVTLKIIMK